MRSGILAGLIVNYKLRNRFWSKVKKSEGCWEWTASTGRRNYGKFKVGSTYVGAHRVAFYLSNGPFDETKLVCHTCDNPRCVNPNHLFLGTVLQNNLDRAKKGRNGKCGHSLVLSESDVAEIRRLIKSGYSQRAISPMFNVSRFCIYEALRR